MRVFTKDTPSEWECTRILSPFSLNFTPIHRQNGNVRGFRALLSSNCLWTPQTIGLFLISTVQRSDCLWTPHTIGMFLISTEQRSDCLWTPQTIGMFLISTEQRSDCLPTPHTISFFLIFNGATRALPQDTHKIGIFLIIDGIQALITLGFPSNWKKVPHFEQSSLTFIRMI